MALTYVSDGPKGKGSKSGGARRGSTMEHGKHHRGQSTRGSHQRNLTMRNRGHGIEPLGRSSLRSKGSSSNSSDHQNKQDRVKAFKNCCRTLMEFMFTQVGVGGMVVAYALMGASIFQYIETLQEDPSLARVDAFRNQTVRNLWNLTHYFNTLNHDMWVQAINDALNKHERGMVGFIMEEGYDQRTNAERWYFSWSLMFALSVISMIGYGNVVPRTETGKIAVIVYACFGIPVYILYFMNMGKVFAAVLKWVYTKAYRWNVRRKWKQSVNYDTMTAAGEDLELDEAYLDELEQQVIVPSTTCLWVLTFYLILGAVMFAEWEKWNYLDSIYFCVISLCKIGFGDFVPGAHEALTGEVHGNEEEGQAKLVMTFVYLLVGMGVVAMCYFLLKEEVTVKAIQFRKRMREKFIRFKVKMGWLPPSSLHEFLPQR